MTEVSDNYSNEMTTWSTLPNEIQTYILLYLPFSSLVHVCRLVSKQMKNQADSDTIWKYHVQRITADRSLPASVATWKKLYQLHTSELVWSTDMKGKCIKLADGNRKAVSMNDGSIIKNRLENFFWQMVLSKSVLTSSLNFAEFVVDEFNSKLQNTRGIMIGIDSTEKNSIVVADSPAWIGLNTGWGYAAKSGELFLPGSRTNHFSRPFSTPYGKGDVVGVYLDFDDRTLVFYVNQQLKGVQHIQSHHWKDNFCFAVAAAHGSTSVTIQFPQDREGCIKQYKQWKKKFPASP